MTPIPFSFVPIGNLAEYHRLKALAEAKPLDRATALGLYDAGLDTADIARRLGVHEACVYNAVFGHRADR